MAISERIRAEADRTIERMQRFYNEYSDDVDDAEELEHRIARIEASVEGCNGLTQDEKIQKTAENVFELTCAQERSYDALRMEMRKSRDEWKELMSDMKNLHSKDYKSLHEGLSKGLADVMAKIEDSGSDTPASMSGKANGLMKIISAHPMLAFYFFLVLLVLVFVSGHFGDIVKLINGGN